MTMGSARSASRPYPTPEEDEKAGTCEGRHHDQAVDQGLPRGGRGREETMLWMRLRITTPMIEPTTPPCPPLRRVPRARPPRWTAT